MKRLSLAGIVLLVSATMAQAHFVFVIPDGDKFQVVFSDKLDKDENVDIGKVAALKLHVRSGAKEAPIEFVKGDHALTGSIPGSGDRTLYGSVVYGVMQRGESKPFLLQYHPKTIVGDLSAKPVGDAVPAEIIPILSGGKLRFQVVSRGKPVADAEVTVMLPKDESKKVKTDAQGRTPEFDAAGRYGAWVSVPEKKSGEHGGKKYDEVRNYATLVIDVRGVKPAVAGTAK